MAKVIAGMTTSLDGFVAEEDGSIERLYPDLESLRGSAYLNDLIEQTGAVLMGRRTFEMGDPDWYVGNYEFQVPIFVITSHPPHVLPKQDGRLTFTFVTEGAASAVGQARDAAGSRTVQVVGGIDIALQLLDAQLVDELSVDIMPVFLGAGRRLFDSPSLQQIQLQKIDVREIGERTSLRFLIKDRGPLNA